MLSHASKHITNSDLIVEFVYELQHMIFSVFYMYLWLTFLFFSCVDLSHNRLEDQTITNVFFNMEKLVSQPNSIINVLPNKDTVHSTLLTLPNVGRVEGYCIRFVCLSVCLFVCSKIPSNLQTLTLWKYYQQGYCDIITILNRV